MKRTPPNLDLKSETRVRVTVELPESFVRLLAAKAGLSKWKERALGEHGENQLDSGDILAWLILLEARGAYEHDIHALTPLMWRNGGPELIHEERKVFKTTYGSKPTDEDKTKRKRQVS